MSKKALAIFLLNNLITRLCFEEGAVISEVKYIINDVIKSIKVYPIMTSEAEFTEPVFGLGKISAESSHIYYYIEIDGGYPLTAIGDGCIAENKFIGLECSEVKKTFHIIPYDYFEFCYNILSIGKGPLELLENAHNYKYLVIFTSRGEYKDGIYQKILLSDIFGTHSFTYFKENSGKIHVSMYSWDNRFLKLHKFEDYIIKQYVEFVERARREGLLGNLLLYHYTADELLQYTFKFLFRKKHGS